MAGLAGEVTRMMRLIPADSSSSATWWRTQLRPNGKSSLGTVPHNGPRRLPLPATGTTAVSTGALLDIRGPLVVPDGLQDIVTHRHPSVRPRQIGFSGASGTDQGRRQSRGGSGTDVVGGVPHHEAAVPGYPVAGDRRLDHRAPRFAAGATVAWAMRAQVRGEEGPRGRTEAVHDVPVDRDRLLQVENALADPCLVGYHDDLKSALQQERHRVRGRREA